MKSKITKIQILKKGILLILMLSLILPSSIYAAENLTLQASTALEKLLYGEIGSVVNKIEEHFKSNTTLYIANETQLRALAEYVFDGNSCQGKRIELLNDIKLDTNMDWTPIGDGYSEFSGTFDGNGYTISNLTYKGTENFVTEGGYYNVGLFGVISKHGTVQNVNVNNSNIIANGLDSNNITNVGNIAGTSYGTILDCSANKMPLNKEQVIEGTKENNYVGLLVGENKGTIKDSEVIEPNTTLKLEDGSEINIDLKVYKNNAQITDFLNTNNFKIGEKIRLEFIIDTYLYTGLEDGQEIKLSNKIDDKGKVTEETIKENYPLVSIGNISATPISATQEEIETNLEDGSTQTKAQTTLTYEYTVTAEEEIEVNNGTVYMNFEKNMNNENLYVYYSEDAENFYTGDRLNKKATCSNLQIYVDSKLPSVEVEAYVEELSESNRYAEGKEIIIKVKSTEKIQATVAPELKVSFSGSGLGKYNYQEDLSKGNAVHVDALLDGEGKTTWIYSYIIEPGDEGTLTIEYLSGTITDLVGNTIDITEIEAKDMNNIYADTTAPTVVITPNVQNSLTNKDTVTYSFIWSEALTEFREEDITVNNGIKGKIVIKDILELRDFDINKDDDINTVDLADLKRYIADEKSKYDENFDLNLDGILDSKDVNLMKEYLSGNLSKAYAVMDITTNIEDGNVGDLQVIIEENACQDLVGHGNVRTESVIRIDRKAPMLQTLEAYAESEIKLNSEIDVVKEYYKTGETIKVVATFDENIIDQKVPELVIQFNENGKSVVLNGEIEANKITYTYTIAEGDEGTLSVRAFNGTVIDAAGNQTKVVRKSLDGNTIIVDTKEPSLEAINVTSTKTSNKAGEIITIEAIYNEPVYVLTTKEDGTKEIVNIEKATEENSSVLAPILKITFDGKDAKGEVKFDGYGQTEGKEDKTKLVYTYTVVGEEAKEDEVIEGDNGKLGIKEFVNSENGQVCDIAGNTSENKAKDIDTKETKADTITPKVDTITADVPNATVSGTEKFYKAGNIIEIIVKYTEPVHEKILDTIKVAFSDETPEEDDYKDVSIIEWKEDVDTIKYTYEIKDGDNGYLYVKVPDGVCKDVAGNENIGKAGEKITTEEIYADTINPDININTDITITQDENNGQIIRVEAKFNEKVFDLINNNISDLDPKVAPEILYGFVGSTDIKTQAAKAVKGDTIVYEVEKEDTISGDFYAAYFKGNLYDRAGNEFYKVGIDTTAPVLKSVEITSNAGISYAPYCREGKEIYVIATFDEPIKAENMKLKAKIGEVELTELLDGEIVNENKTKVKFTYEVQKNDNGKFGIVYDNIIGDVSGEIDKNITEENADNTYGWVEDEYGNKNKIYSFSDEGVTPIGEAEADTKDPYIESIEAVIDGETITTYAKEDGKDAVIAAKRTNTNIIEYIVTYNEEVPYQHIENLEKITITNGKIIERKAIDKYSYKIVVQTTVEGVQSLIINEATVEDKAGNTDKFVRLNAVTVDFTKPTVRFISEYNGGVYVLPTNIGKVEIRPNVEISEDIYTIEYKWDDDKDYVGIKNYSSSSDIAVPTKAFTEAGTHVLYIRVVDLAGNDYETSKTYHIKDIDIDIELSTTDYVNTEKTPVIATVLFRNKYDKDEDGLTDNRKVTFKAEGSNEVVELNANGVDANGGVQYAIWTNGTVYAEATDKVGNKVFTEQEIRKIDNEYPDIEIELDGANLVIGTGEEKAVIRTNVETTDNKWVKETKYVFLTDDINVSGYKDMTEEQRETLKSKITNTLQRDEEGNQKVQIEATSTKDKPYYLYVIASDEAGNETIVKSNPFTVVDTNGGKVTTTVEGENGPEEKEEIVPAEKPVEQLIIFNDLEKDVEEVKDKEYIGVEYDDTIIKESKITITNEGYGYEYEENKVEIYGATTIIVEAWDACGNKVVRTHEVKKEDIIGPDFSIYGNPENWTNDDVELEVYSNAKLQALTLNGENILGDNKYRVNKVIEGYGIYTFEATDIYNNTSKQEIEVKIDKSAPEITDVKIEDGKIVITANDIDKTLNKELSGLSEYAITDTTEVPVEWSKSNVINVTKDENFFVWVKDNAGNITMKEEIVVRDITAPELTITTDVKLDKWTNTDIKVEVKSNEELSSLVLKYKEMVEQEGQITEVEKEENILETKTYTIISNGTYEVIGTDKSGNPTKETIIVSKIDKDMPVISEVTNVGKDITITATDEISGVKEYAITDTTEVPVEWSESNVIKVTEDGIFYAWVKDNAGNVYRAENAIVVDTTAPTVTFNYLSQTVTVGMPVEANVVTNEDAIISYSWDKETWVNSEELISRLTVSEKTTTPGKYTLYVKAKDNSGNESKVQTLEFEVTTIEEIKQPDIIFEDIPTVQVNGARYVKISSQMTTELLTDSMNKEALCGKTPEYINLTEDGKLRTGSEITINGKTKYIVVVNGDVNGDGKVTFLGDIVKANDCRIGIGELTTIQMLAADINNNGKIEFISDIVAMNDYRLGIINSL